MDAIVGPDDATSTRGEHSRRCDLPLSGRVRRRAAILALLTVLASMTLVGATAQVASADCHEFKVVQVQIADEQGYWRVQVMYANEHGQMALCEFNTYMPGGTPATLANWECVEGRVRAEIIYGGNLTTVTTDCMC